MTPIASVRDTSRACAIMRNAPQSNDGRPRAVTPLRIHDQTHGRGSWCSRSLRLGVKVTSRVAGRRGHRYFSASSPPPGNTRRARNVAVAVFLPLSVF